MWRAWRVQLDGRIWMIVICPHAINESGLNAILHRQFPPHRITKIAPAMSLWSLCQKARPKQHRF
jgi:hypothetical protein